jgi:hypothetical protein
MKLLEKDIAGAKLAFHTKIKDKKAKEKIIQSIEQGQQDFHKVIVPKDVKK